jgi:hypothetical protein
MQEYILAKCNTPGLGVGEPDVIIAISLQFRAIIHR